MGVEPYSNRQLTGSEYGGVEFTMIGIQPKGPDALKNGDRLRMGYLTGNELDTNALEDHRQMLGLRPANGRYPVWMEQVNDRHDHRLDSEAQRKGYGNDYNEVPTDYWETP